jgi:hypothetical protein
LAQPRHVDLPWPESRKAGGMATPMTYHGVFVRRVDTALRHNNVSGSFTEEGDAYFWDQGRKRYAQLTFAPDLNTVTLVFHASADYDGTRWESETFAHRDDAVPVVAKRIQEWIHHRTQHDIQNMMKRL